MMRWGQGKEWKLKKNKWKSKASDTQKTCRRIHVFNTCIACIEYMYCKNHTCIDKSIHVLENRDKKLWIWDLYQKLNLFNFCNLSQNVAEVVQMKGRFYCNLWLFHAIIHYYKNKYWKIREFWTSITVLKNYSSNICFIPKLRKNHKNVIDQPIRRETVSTWSQIIGSTKMAILIYKILIFYLFIV